MNIFFKILFVMFQRFSLSTFMKKLENGKIDLIFEEMMLSRNWKFYAIYTATFEQRQK